ncbi:unnamed protein product [Ixodes pacificus]
MMPHITLKLSRFFFCNKIVLLLFPSSLYHLQIIPNRVPLQKNSPSGYCRTMHYSGKQLCSQKDVFIFVFYAAAHHLKTLQCSKKYLGKPLSSGKP